MADKEVTVKVTTETDISSLEELDAKLDEIADNRKLFNRISAKIFDLQQQMKESR